MSRSVMAAHGELRGRAFLLVGEFARAGGAVEAARALRAAGARVVHSVAERPDFVVHGHQTQQLAALFAAATDREGLEGALEESTLWAWLDAHDARRALAGSHGGSAITPTGEAGEDLAALVRLVDPEDPVSVDRLERAVRTASSAALDAATRAATRATTPGERRFLALRLADPRLVDGPLRAAVVRAIESAGGSAALDALAEGLRAVRGRCGVAEAAALGRLVARGTRRFGGAGVLFALEFETAERHAVAPELEALAARAGAVERLTDPRGAPILRVRCAALPARFAPDAPLHALLQIAGRRRRARVWLAGLSLPAALPWPVWTTLFAALGAR